VRPRPSLAAGTEPLSSPGDLGDQSSDEDEEGEAEKRVKMEQEMLGSSGQAAEQRPDL
jgi:hypothetical protein